jgi:type IV pilus assembly protein PilC
MIAVGERSNALDDVLTRSCDFFDEQVSTTISGITSKIQPILLGVMGGVVGTLFVAIYSPMLSIMTTLT